MDDKKNDFKKLVLSLKNLLGGEEIVYLDSWYKEYSIRIVLGNRKPNSDWLIYLSPFSPPPIDWLIIRHRESPEGDPVVITNWEAMESDWIPEEIKFWVINHLHVLV